MKKIGFFLAYAPEQPIKDQGIGRLMAFILSGILKSKEAELVIGTPRWYKENTIDFLKDQNIDTSKIELLTTSHIPVFLNIKDMLFKIKSFLFQSPSTMSKKRGPFRRALSKISQKVFKGIFYWLSLPPFISILIGIIIFACLLMISPLLLILALFVGTFFFLKRYKSKLMPIVHRLRIVVTFFHNAFSGRTYDELRRHELHRLIRKINKRKDINIWFIPTMFWPEIQYIKAKKIIAAPDIVLVDFATLFPFDYGNSIFEHIKTTLKAADHAICYSSHVKQRHLVEAFKVPAEKISIIKHGFTDLSVYLNFQKKEKNKKPKTLREHSLKIIQDYQKKELKKHPYLASFNLSDMQFLFYSSQVRPHKNFYNLVKAYKILLRDRFLNIKLISTGSYFHEPKVNEFIVQNRLQYDILSLPDVPSNVLAALNNLAICAINPSLFEGGFPFTFNEAYSVGTPSIMSRIPVVLDEIKDSDLQGQMLFDPYNLTDMADKIEWAIENREMLYRLQKPLYQKFSQRSWAIVANEYLELFKKIESSNVSCKRKNS